MVQTVHKAHLVQHLELQQLVVVVVADIMLTHFQVQVDLVAAAQDMVALVAIVQ
jgi:hypothetical protein